MTYRLASLCLIPLIALDAHAAPSAPTVPFAAHLAGAVAKQPGNQIYSPASVEVALAMAREGAIGKTAAEMDAVLGDHARTEAQQLIASFKSAAAVPGEPIPPVLELANRLFADQRTPFEKAFTDITSDRYKAPVEQLDFRKQFEAGRLHINQWVADQTHGKIKDLLPPHTIDTDTRMVLVNAIYLKAQWATPFQLGATGPAPFAIDGAKSKPVPTMHTVAWAKWGEHGGARLLDLPYYSGTGPQLSMLVVVPDAKPLREVEAAYAKDGLAPYLGALAKAGDVDVALPKFEVGMSLDLSAALEGLGMPRAFTDYAEFSGISAVATKISKVIHKAWIKVDEAGTEAAAATAVVMAEITSVKPPPHDFKVDRSFAFFIHDQHGTVLFGGRILDPSAT